jgi:hypothetical protein
MMHLARRIACSAVLAVLSACSSQVDPAYQGEPLVSVEGTIVDPPAPIDRGPVGLPEPPILSTLPDGAVVMLQWPGVILGRTYYTVGATVRKEGEVSRFDLSFFEPPPNAAFDIELDTGEQAVAVGYIVLFPPGYWIDPRFNPFPNEIWGYSLDAFVVYFARDGVPGYRNEVQDLDPVERAAQAYGVPAKRGYHLVRVTHGDREASDRCRWQRFGQCENNRCLGTSGVAIDAYQRDWMLCQKAFPDAPSCFECPSSEIEPRCNTVERPESPPRCPPSWSLEPNLDDQSIPVTITLGATYREMFF